MKLFSNKYLLFAFLWFCPALIMILAFYLATKYWGWSKGLFENVIIPLSTSLFLAIIEYRRIIKIREKKKV
jgi:hypothetical protein